jgi:hypothetical protein
MAGGTDWGVFSDSEQDSYPKDEDAHQEELRMEKERRKQEFSSWRLLRRAPRDGHQETGVWGEGCVFGMRGTSINGLLVKQCSFPFSISAIEESVIS